MAQPSIRRLNVVVATLRKAVLSLQRREPTLTPIERMKLKALRRNLDAVLEARHVPDDQAQGESALKTQAGGSPMH